MKKFLIAVSGGPDSMYLLNKFKNKDLIVCHVNYHDRDDTDNDQRIVKNFCEKFNLKLYVYDTIEQNSKEIYKDKNLQVFYRKIRYDFFEKIASENNIKICLIAHNKNDFLESYYMQKAKYKNLLYYGIKKKSKYNNLTLYRPLINKWKSNLEKYCLNKKIEFAIDKTNFLDIYERNKVRKILNQKSKFFLNCLYLKILIINFKKFFIKLKVDSLFVEWKKNNFNVNYIKKINNKYLNFLWYSFLVDINIKANLNKINLIKNFVLNSQNSNKFLRIKKNTFLYIKNNLIKIKNINNE